uniref:Uncharacterized protein n=1 Tax=Arundo donax TaxID=35708 RepID=A0A0A9GHJ0_ARUDO
MSFIDNYTYYIPTMPKLNLAYLCL